jgi:hypothetical protein
VRPDECAYVGSREVTLSRRGSHGRQAGGSGGCDRRAVAVAVVVGHDALRVRVIAKFLIQFNACMSQNY